MKEIVIELSNKPGELAKVCDSLGRVGVNIVSLVGEGNATGAGVVRLITADENTAVKTLTQHGFKIKTTEVMTLKLDDRQGELAKVTLRLAHAGINVDSIYILNKEKGLTELALAVNNEKKAREALK